MFLERGCNYLQNCMASLLFLFSSVRKQNILLSIRWKKYITFLRVYLKIPVSIATPDGPFRMLITLTRVLDQNQIVASQVVTPCIFVGGY
jgi:hypothetical protein